MGKNHFKLDQVLHFRQEVEKVRQLEFIAARGELEQAEQRLRKDEEAAEELAREFLAKQQEGILAVELQLYAEFSRKKKNDIKSQRVEVDTLDRKVAETRETLLSASKDKKVLQTFKDKKAEAHKQEMAGRERNFLDEIAIQGGGREKP